MPNQATFNQQQNNCKYIILALVMITLDQLSKHYFNSHYYFGEVRQVIAGFFNFTLLYNNGAAFSFLADAGGWQKYLFSALALAVIAYLIYGIYNEKFSSRMKIAAALIIAGALGNVIDRWTLGHVVDFLQFYHKSWYYPAFNIADSCICLGALLMITDRGNFCRARKVSETNDEKNLPR